jgi:hypothetical protein
MDGICVADNSELLIAMKCTEGENTKAGLSYERQIKQKWSEKKNCDTHVSECHVYDASMVVHPIPALILAYIKRISQILFGLGMIM